MSGDERDVLVALHEHVRDLLTDLAVDDEELSESEYEDVVESMDQVTQMLLDSLDVHVVGEVDGNGDGELDRVILSVRWPGLGGLTP
jgi:hypothetical protein